MLNAPNTHLASLYIGLSAPCGNVDSLYSQRDVVINELYDRGSCSYSLNGSSTHSGYLATGFSETEYDVLSENKIYESVKAKIINFNDQDLKSNSFKLYYKPYSIWKDSC